MNILIRQRWLLCAFAISLAACGGSNGENDDDDTPQPAPQNQAPSVSFNQPADSTSVSEGASVHVVVTASDTDGTLTHVRLSLDGALVREDTTAPYEWGTPGTADDALLRNLAPGSYTLMATARDDDGAESSVTRSFVVTAGQGSPDGAPTISFTQPMDGQSFSAGSSVHVIANATDTDGSVSNVRLLLNGSLVRQENVAPYEWGSPGGTNDPALQNLASGSYTLTAIATDDAGLESETQIAFTVTDTTPPPTGSGTCAVSGDTRQWHRVSISCTGFSADEANTATFTDYRFNVTFSQSATQLTVPGHFAADGNAADSGATAGDTWRAYFSPPTTGPWNYTVSFRSGNDIAVDMAADAGDPMSVIDGESGSFTVTASPPAATDMRTRGLLEHRDGERYLRFAGNNQVFIEGGMDSPENIFGFADFDNTVKFSDAGSCKGILHQFAPHAGDWNGNDPVWQGDKGRNLIGLVNYMASTGVNAIYIMANTVRGDGCDAHPWAEYNANGQEKRFDVSKLDQWERVLTHMTANGILIHVVTQETENDQLLNGGDLGLERRLYYRELVSRFGHHPALQWNLGEENTNTANQQRAFADFLRAIDPYAHPIFMHTFPNDKDKYTALLGHPTFDGPTMQFGGIPTSATGSDGVYGTTLDWLSQSSNAGKPWVVTFTEASGNNAPTPNTPVSTRQRIYWMWASAMSGGGGFEWYLKNPGAGHAYDLAVEDLREFDAHWQQSGHFVRFWRDIVQSELEIDPQQLSPDNAVTDSNSDWVLADSGNAYILFLREGGGTNITLPNNANYDVLWYNPRTGARQAGATLQGPGIQFTGAPPSETNADWAAVIFQRNGTASADYQQIDGLVVMEAENTATADRGLWLDKTDVTGFSGSGYIEFDGNTALNGPAQSPLRYTFRVNQSGLHYLHMRVARETVTINGEVRTDVANDAYIRLDGDYVAGPNAGNNHGDHAPLNALTRNTKYFGGNDKQFVWATGNRLDLGGETNKRIPVYDLKAGETYTFTLSGRSRFFKVDRIVFRHESVSRNNAENLSRAETR
ncbi:MAG: Ig-like domain-containing protein [Pseudomonadota bacterium]